MVTYSPTARNRYPPSCSKYGRISPPMVTYHLHCDKKLSFARKTVMYFHRQPRKLLNKLACLLMKVHDCFPGKQQLLCHVENFHPFVLWCIILELFPSRIRFCKKSPCPPPPVPIGEHFQPQEKN